MSLTETIPAVSLPSGAQMPALGLGVFLMEPSATQAITETALGVGYNFVDTAAQYGNEAEVGAAIAACGVPRDQLFIATKVANPDQGYDSTLKAAEKSAKLLGLEQIDLYMLHWPSPWRGLYVDTWKALIHLRDQGLVKDIGVCNFMPEHLQKIMDETGVTPAVNQIELHPAFQQPELRKFHREHGIVTQGWGPLGQGKYHLYDLAGIADIAAQHNKSVYQVVIRWHIQNGVVIFPKASSLQRLEHNADVFDFELSAENMDTIASLDVAFRLGHNPYFRR